MTRSSAVVLLITACGGSPVPSPAPMPGAAAALPAPDRSPAEPEPPAERCVDVFTADGSTLVRGTTEADLELSAATPEEIVALAPGTEVEATMQGDLVAVTAPVRGFFAGTLARRCGPPTAPLLFDFDEPPSRTIEIPEDARQLHEVSVDVDADGIPDRVRVLTTDEERYGYFDLELSRTETPSTFRVLLDDGIVSGCFGIVDGRPAYAQSLTRGSSAGVRVHILRADGTWRAQSGLLGRTIAGARGDAPDALVPPASQALWQGSLDDWLETPPRRCPLDGLAIDVPRDAHYPIDDDPASNELALVRVHGLSSSYEGLPDGPGPVTEMQTASSE